MRKLIVSNIISLDGCYSGPGGDVMAMPFDHGRDKGGSLVGIADVGGMEGRARGQVFRRVATADGDRATGPGQPRGNDTTQPACATGDDGDATREIEAAR